MKWAISLSTGMFLHQPLLQALPSIHSAGFKRIQISGFRPHFDYYDRALIGRVRQELDHLSLRVTSMHAPYSVSTDVTSPEEGGRLAAVAEVKAAADALAALGGATLVVHAGSEADAAVLDGRPRLQRGIRSLTEVYEHCQARGISIAIEDMLGHKLGGRTEDLQYAFEQFPMQDVGFCLDTGHSFLNGRLFERIKLFGPRLVMVHAHDTHGNYDDHLPPGEGSIPWPSVLNALTAVGFQGEIVLEIGEEPDISSLLQRTLRSIHFLERCLQGKPYSISMA